MMTLSETVYRSQWTIEQVADQMDAIRAAGSPWIFPVVPSGHVDHIRQSFEMAKSV